MACSSCGTKSGGCAPAGCKSNGTCGTSGCNKLNVYDWFKDMDLPHGQKPFDIIEVRFKGSRKEFYRNSEDLELYVGDYVLTESGFGYDVGVVSATGEIVRLQLKKYRVQEDSAEIKKILRKAGEKELERFEQLKEKENSTLERARTLSFELKLQMKLSDIEFQGDGKKVTFFYTAENRVDFRELIKRYAEEFRVKIEMRHISYREEASRLGGIGVCGRQLCCSTWLTDYKQVNVGAARYQNLSINMEKLAGQCGKLKCCLNYELDTYLEALDAFPKQKSVKITANDGVAMLRKTDILKKIMWFSYEGSQTWLALHVDKVREFMDANDRGENIASLAEVAAASQVVEKVSLDEEPQMMNNAELFNDPEFEAVLNKRREVNKNSRGDRRQSSGKREDSPRNFDKTDRRNVQRDRPNQDKPNQQRPPQNRPTQERTDQNRPPQQRPPQNRPPQNRPPQNRPPQNRPPQNRTPNDRQKGDGKGPRDGGDRNAGPPNPDKE